jgi:signal transduction histidine kinase
VVEVFVPEAELTRGVDDTWWALIGIAFLLLLVSVLASDRLAARVVRSARGLAAAARTVGDGDLSPAVPTAGPRELAEAAPPSTRWPTGIATMRAAERELIADLSHRLRTPLTALRLEADHVRRRAGALRPGHRGDGARGRPPDPDRPARRWTAGRAGRV